MYEQRDSELATPWGQAPEAPASERISTTLPTDLPTELPPPPNGDSTVGVPPPPTGAPALGADVSSDQPRPRKGMKIALGLFGVLVLLVAGVVASLFFLVFDGQGQAAESVPPTASVGECFEIGTSRRAIPCALEHHFEVFATVTYSSDMPYPSRLQLFGGDPYCDQEFEAYVGQGIYRSSYLYTLVVPSQAEWSAGARTSACALHTQGKSSIVGSVRAS